MKSWRTPTGRGSWITSAIVVGATLVAAIVFRAPLGAWITGQPLGSSEGAAVTASMGPFAVEARLSPDPPREKDQALVLVVRDAGGQTVGDAAVAVEYDMPAMGAMAEMKGGATVSAEGPGRYRARFDLPMGGTWTLRTHVQSKAGSAAQSFTMTVGRAGLSAVGGARCLGTQMPSCGAPEGRLEPTGPSTAEPPDLGAIDHYTCSMHPSVRSSGPGTCPICGMNLVPVTQEQQQEGVVMIDEARSQLIGVRTERVVQAPMRETFRAAGRVAYDESTLSDVNLKVRGWITKLYVNETGQRVERGQPLFTMYSPELYNAEQDFLLAAHSPTAPEGEGSSAGRSGILKGASRQRLHLLGLTDAQIDALAASGKPAEEVAIPSPASGYVIEKNVVEGASVDAGMRLYRIAALSRVWVEADVYEADLAHVHPGQPATVTLDYLPGRTFEAKVAYVYPYLDPVARTGRVRFEIANKQLELRPGMYASVELSGDLGTHIQVPASAVVYTGPRRLAFVDLGGGRFRPTEVQVGTESNGMYEVLAGLSPGDVVATSGVFLIAAEARIRTAAKYWDSTVEPGDAATGSAASSPRPMASPSSGSQAPSHGSAAMRQPARSPPAPPASSPAPAVDYACPMHPEVHSTTPGTCPKCGMDLEPRRQP